MSLLFNMLSRLVTAYLPRSKRLHFMAAVTICSDFRAPEKSLTLSIVSPSICHEVIRPDAMILVFWMLSFKPSFYFPLTFIKRLFSSSSLSAIRVVSSAYLRLLIFLPAIMIPAYASSSPVFYMMYSAYKLNKQGDNIQPWHTPFPIWNQSVVPYPVLTVACWPAYRFLRRRVRWSGIPISWRIFHSLWWSTQSNLRRSQKIRSRCFSGTPCFCDDPTGVGSLISGSSAFYKSNVNTCKFTVIVLLKPGLENFEHYSANVWDECNRVVA